MVVVLVAQLCLTLCDPTEYLQSTTEQSTTKHGMPAEGRREPQHPQDEEQAQAALGCMQIQEQEPHPGSGFLPPGVCTVLHGALTCCGQGIGLLGRVS